MLSHRVWLRGQTFERLMGSHRGVMPQVGASCAAFHSSAMRHCLNYESLQTATVMQRAPEWKAQAVGGPYGMAPQEISLSQFRGNKYVVILFYPLDFTFVCPTEILAFSDRAEEFNKANTQVLAVSVDSIFSHRAWINTPRKSGGLGPNLAIPLVSDINKDIARDYGVLIPSKGIALRGLFIIDTAGTLRSMTVNDIAVGRNVDEVKRLVSAFQYVDKHGDEVIPCDWNEGKPTMTPSKASEYFEKHN